jgi:hypothetical protein
MMTEPCAHAAFLPNGVTLIFGEGSVPPHPDTVRDAAIAAALQAEEYDATQRDDGDTVLMDEQTNNGPVDGLELSAAPEAPDYLYRSTSESTYDGVSPTDPVPQPPPQTAPAPTFTARTCIINWADEIEEELEYALQAAPQAHGPERVLSNDDVAGDVASDPTTVLDTIPDPTPTQSLAPSVPRPSSALPVESSISTNPDELEEPAPAPAAAAAPAQAPQPRLPPDMFQCEDELEQPISYETYSYGARGEVPTMLRSNLRTVIDTRLSEQEQMERHRRVTRLNFGSLAQSVCFTGAEWAEVKEGHVTCWIQGWCDSEPDND